MKINNDDKDLWKLIGKIIGKKSTYFVKGISYPNKIITNDKKVK
jgi:hypothetical protein